MCFKVQAPKVPCSGFTGSAGKTSEMQKVSAMAQELCQSRTMFQRDSTNFSNMSRNPQKFKEIHLTLQYASMRSPRFVEMILSRVCLASLCNLSDPVPTLAQCSTCQFPSRPNIGCSTAKIRTSYCQSQQRK